MVQIITSRKQLGPLTIAGLGQGRLRSLVAGLLGLLILPQLVMGQGTAPDVGVRFQPPTAVILTNATIVESPGRTLESGDLLIRNGKIVKVGVDLIAPADAKVIDCTNKYLYPALVDAMVEFSAAADTTQAAAWNSSVQPQRQLSQQLKPEASKLESLRKAGIGVVLAVPDNGIVKGQSCVLTTAAKPLEATLLRPIAFQHLRLYPDRGSSRGAYPSSPMGAVALVRQTLLDASWYQQALQAFQSNPAIPAPEQNAALAALEPVIRGRQIAVIDGTNDLYALRADRLAKEFSLKLVIRGSGREYRQLSEIAATRRPMIVPVDFPKPPEVGTLTAAMEASLQSLLHWHFAPENPGRMEKAGIDFVLTSSGLDSPADLIPNVQKAIERGLSEEAALAAVTTRAAKLLEIDHLAGTLEVGKLANLLVTDGPLFAKSSKIVETWVAGERNEWNEANPAALSGTWSIKIQGTSLLQDLKLKMTGAGKKLKGELGLASAFEAKPEGKSTGEDTKSDSSTSASKAADGKVAEGKAADKKAPPAKSELLRLKFDGYRLTASFNVKPLLPEARGMAYLNGVIEASGDIKDFAGTILWPDGLTSSFTASLDVSSSVDKPSKAEDNSGENTDIKPKANQDEEKRSEGDASGKPAEGSPKVDAEFKPEVTFPLGAYGVTSLPEQAEWVVIRGATIWTCGARGILESGDILLHRGHIAAVEKHVDAPENAVVIQATGMHVTPGIIDCHSHMATDGGVNEGSQAVTSEVRVGDFIDPADITIYRQLAGGVTAANILHGSANPIGGQNQVIKLRWGAADELLKMVEAPGGIKFALGENVKQSSLSESDNPRYPLSRMGVEQIMRDRFEAAKLYRQKQQAWVTKPEGLPPRRDLELDAIAEVLEGSRWVHCHSYRQDEILTFLRTMEDYGVTVGTLQHILEGYKVADAMAKHGAMGSSFSDWWAYKVEVWDAIPFNGALMHRAGVVVSFNSDDDELARHLNHEAAKAVKYGGVPAEEALKFVTLNPAKQLRIDDYVVSIEVDKQADLVMWNGPPLSTLSVCMQTWIDGRKYFDRQEDLKRRLADAKLHQQLVQKVLDSGEKPSGRSADAGDPSTWWLRYDEFCNQSHRHDGRLLHNHAEHMSNE